MCVGKDGWESLPWEAQRREKSFSVLLSKAWDFAFSKDGKQKEG